MVDKSPPENKLISDPDAYFKGFADGKRAAEQRGRVTADEDVADSAGHNYQIQLVSGKPFSLSNPDPADVTIEDIATLRTLCHSKIGLMGTLWCHIP